jgi:hypothetical protein
MKNLAPQRRKERKEEEEEKKEEKQRSPSSCFCLSLRPLRLCGANFFDLEMLS